jgi:hypothetical protein
LFGALHKGTNKSYDEMTSYIRDKIRMNQTKLKINPIGSTYLLLLDEIPNAAGSRLPIVLESGLMGYIIWKLTIGCGSGTSTLVHQAPL